MSFVGVWTNMESFKLFRYGLLFWMALSVMLNGMKAVARWLSETTGLSSWKREGMNSGPRFQWQRQHWCICSTTFGNLIGRAKHTYRSAMILKQESRL